MNSMASMLIATLISLWAATAGATSWWSIEESRTYASSSGRVIKASVLTIDLSRANLRIVSVPFEAKAAPGSSELSLRDLGETLLSHPRYRSKEWIAVNGGFSSYRVDVPLGLLVVDGKVYSTLNKEKPKGTSAAPLSEYGQLRWSGILCQLEAGNRWEIIPATRYRPSLCKQALQAGPVLVEPNLKIGVAANEPKKAAPYKRTVICLDNEFRIRVVLTEETHLLPLAAWLSKPNSAGGLGCRIALNLSGETSSGVAIKSMRSRSIRVVGEGSFPIPTALIFEGL